MDEFGPTSKLQRAVWKIKLGHALSKIGSHSEPIENNGSVFKTWIHKFNPSSVQFENRMA